MDESGGVAVSNAVRLEVGITVSGLAASSHPLTAAVVTIVPINVDS